MIHEGTGQAAVSEFDDYIGRSETVSGRIVAQSMDLMAATLNRTFADMSPVGSLPPLWHLLILQRPAPQSELGPDGHPRRGGLIPPIALPRRMFAGARVRFISTLHVGDEVERTTTIKSITSKTGRSGNMVFVTLEQVFHGPQGVAIVEEQDLVFRENDLTRSVQRNQLNDLGKPSGFSVVETVNADPVLLFRYSAATGNSHRIHYDLAYVRDVENYPNLIVHGPLQAIMLADLATRYLRRPLTKFEFRILKPIFVDTPFYCVARTENGKVLVQTIDFAHEVCVSAHAE